MTVSLAISGCAVLRLADYAAPGLRVDHAGNPALPSSDDASVQDALERWRGLSASEKRQLPTPYHAYVDTPAPGTFEGDHAVGLAFSGGGTRGTFFGAVCVMELEKLGDLLVDTQDGTKRVDLLGEVDYVSGVSTGSIPAAVFALARGDHCPEDLALDRWPDCFNKDVVGYCLKHLAMRPDRVARDLVFDMNSRPILCGGIAASFFEGKPYKPRSGLTFAQLPSTPVVLMGSTVVNDPGTPFVQTRLPYRYALDRYPETAWGVGVQSFESFHTDPLAYSLGEACYNSSAFPGYMRSGLMRVREDAPWVFEDLDAPSRERMERARHQAGYENTYDLKDGGLVDNRGIDAIDRVFERLAEDASAARRPILLALDAGYRELRLPEPGSKIVKRGWFDEVYAASRASWQTGQDAYERVFEAHAAQGAYALVRFRYTAWLPHLPRAGEDAPSPETSHLVELCRDEPLIGDTDRLLEVARGVGTTMGGLTDEELAAIRICAKFAVWDEKEAVLEWASELYESACEWATSPREVPGPRGP